MVNNRLLSEINQSIGSDYIDNIRYTNDIINDHKISSIIDFDYKSILNAPPKNSSISTSKELIYISKITNNRNSKDIQLIKEIDNDASSLVVQFCQYKNINFPKTQFDELYNIFKPLILNTKYFFNRARPYQLAKFYGLTIDVIKTNTHQTPSYPSGHTVYARLAADLVSNSYPEFQYELDQIVNKSAYARVLQGVHYPSDNDASIIFTDAIFAKLKIRGL